MLTSLRSLTHRALHLLRRIDWLGPLLVRLALAAVFVPSGWGKLHHLDDVTEFFASLNIPAPGIQAAFIATLELVGGVLVLVGFGTRIASALLIGTMAVAIYTAKLPELHGVVELAATTEFAYLAMFAWLVVSGAGKASLDHLIGRRGASEPLAGVTP